MAKRKIPTLLVVFLLVIAAMAIYQYFGRQAITPPGNIPTGTEVIANMIYDPAWSAADKTAGHCSATVKFRTNEFNAAYGAGDWLAVDVTGDGQMEGYVFDRIVTTKNSSVQGKTITQNNVAIKDKFGNAILKQYNFDTNQQEVWVYKGEQVTGEMCTDHYGNQNAECSAFNGQNDNQMQCMDNTCNVKQCTTSNCIVTFRTSAVSNNYNAAGAAIVYDTNNDGTMECYVYDSYFTGWSPGTATEITKTPNGYGLYWYNANSLILYYGSHPIYVPAATCPISTSNHPVAAYANPSQEISDTHCCAVKQYTYYVFKQSTINAVTTPTSLPSYYNGEQYSTAPTYGKYYCSGSNLMYALCYPYSDPSYSQYTAPTIIQQCDFSECGDPNIGNNIDEAKCGVSTTTNRPYKTNSQVCIPSGTAGTLYKSDATGMNLVSESCPYGCGTNNICKKCNPPSYRCNGNVQQSCSNTNQWVDQYTCQVGCQGSQTGQSSPTTCTQTCAPNEYYCSAVSGGTGIAKCDSGGESKSTVSPTTVGCTFGCTNQVCLHSCIDCDSNTDGTADGCTSAANMCQLTCTPGQEQCIGNARNKCVVTTEGNDYAMQPITGGECQVFGNLGGCQNVAGTTSCLTVCPYGITSGNLCYQNPITNISATYTCSNGGKTITQNNICVYGCKDSTNCETYCGQQGVHANQKFCSGDDLYTCNADESGTTGAPVHCPGGCANGACLQVAGCEGKSNQKICQGGALFWCGDNGITKSTYPVNQTQTVCPTGICNTAGTDCGLVCSRTGQDYCVNGEIRHCSSDGYTETVKSTCPAGSQCNTAGTACTTICTSNELFCSQGDLYRCGSTGMTSTLIQSCGTHGCNSNSVPAKCNTLCTSNTWYCMSGSRSAQCAADGMSNVQEQSCGTVGQCNITTGRCMTGCAPGSMRCLSDNTHREQCNVDGLGYTLLPDAYNCPAQLGCTISGDCVKRCEPALSPQCSTDSKVLSYCNNDGSQFTAQTTCGGRCINSMCENITFNLAQTTFAYGDSLEVPIEVRYATTRDLVSNVPNMRVELLKDGVSLRNMLVPLSNGTAKPAFLTLSSGGDYVLKETLTSITGITQSSQQNIYLSKDLVVRSQSKLTLWLDDLKIGVPIQVQVLDGTTPVDVSGLQVKANINGTSVITSYQKDMLQTIGLYEIKISSPVVGRLALNITPLQVGSGGQQTFLSTSNLNYDIALPTISIESNVQKENNQLSITASVTSRGTALEADSVTATIAVPGGQTDQVTLTKVRAGLYAGYYTPPSNGQYQIKVEAVKDGYQSGRQDATYDQGNHCTNGIKDADETDVDCGGSCAACGGIGRKIPYIPWWTYVLVAGGIIGLLIFLKKKGIILKSRRRRK